MQQVTQDNWNSIIEKELAVIQFSAPWCGPCKSQAQVLDEVSTSNNSLFFGKIDIEEASDLADSFKVRSVPTIVFLRKGKESNRLVGFQTKQKVQAAISA